MRAVFPFLLAIIITVGSVRTGAQGVEFKEKSFDFGTIHQGEIASHTFEFRNTGRDTVFLLKPHASCGCTAAMLSASTIPPGKSGQIEVRYNAFQGMTGKVMKTVDVSRTVRGTEEHVVQLEIHADVVGEIIPDTSMIRFETTVGTKQRISFHLRSNSTDTLKLDNITVSITEYLDTTAGMQYHADKVIAKPLTDYSLQTQDEELAPGTQTELILEVRGHEKGQMNGHIRIALPHSEIRIPVTGVILRNRSPGIQ